MKRPRTINTDPASLRMILTAALACLIAFTSYFAN